MRDMQEIVSMLTSTTRVLTALLSAVAAVSLLVGGIGIMNIMLVSVTERTREIGTRLAIGARERDVLMQFLVEAVVLSSFGGVCGILRASGPPAAGPAPAIPFVFQPGIVATAFAFSVAVGVRLRLFPGTEGRQTGSDPSPPIRIADPGKGGKVMRILTYGNRDGKKEKCILFKNTGRNGFSKYGIRCQGI